MKVFAYSPLSAECGVRNAESSSGARPRSGLQPSAFSFQRCSSERGIALVVTLIMLAVITFMAIAFLVLSRGERTSTATATDQSLARLAADNALARAQIELVAPMMASGNFNSGGLLVSTNFINPAGFIRSANPQVSANATNVAYNYVNSVGLSVADSLQNLANLQINPRPPVFIPTNTVTGASDFRYYLDLNRNGAFEPTGWIGVTNNFNQWVRPNLDYVQGDPQWIGGLEFPDRRHSADNYFLYRYAYMAVPISQALDINYIHNAARNPAKVNIDRLGGDFLRNQGVGTWEINLASFLYDLNTNTYAWGGPYIYRPQLGPGFPAGFVGGNAFVDACSILTNRYGGWLNYQARLGSVKNLFFNGPFAFANHTIDGYTAGPLMTGPSPFGFDPDYNPAARATYPWPGADNTNHFFSTQDLFDPNKTSPNFAFRLQAAGTNIDTYDRYTFYRLLSQLGTDSAPEPAGKINLNYDNMVQSNAQGIVSATNFFTWRPADFFTITANALLANAGFTNMTVTNLIVYPFNFYTPAVHRLLQLAVNIYDASGATNYALALAPPFFPTVLRPIFRRVPTPTNFLVEIVGYREVVNANMAIRNLAPIMVELDNPASPIGGPSRIPVLVPGAKWAPSDKNEPMVSGIPLLIGAKKGFPNFNELAMQTQVLVSRLLEFRRAPGSSDGPIIRTNQMYVLQVTNAFGLEAWNSYLTNYQRDLQLQTSMQMTAIITNELGGANVVFSNRQAFGAITNIPPNTWKGWATVGQAPYSMILPLGTTNGFLWTNSTATYNYPWLEPQTHIFPPATRGDFYFPHWWLNLNTRLQFILVDTSVNRIVDYVNINNWERTVDITTNLYLGYTINNLVDTNNPANQWLTTRLGFSLNPNVPTYGVINQIQIGLNGAPAWTSYSMDPTVGLDQESAVDGFRNNLLGWSPLYQKDQGKVFYKSNVFYAPFDPYRPLFIHTSWQANDPLVHYTAGDLIDLSQNETNRVDFQSHIPPLDNIGKINNRYRPWGGNPLNQDPMTDNQMAVKDPWVTRSDDWDFPTNKFANIGWLGRVHRGTPWQTVFLKSTNFLQVLPAVPQPQLAYDPNMVNWQKWTGNPFQDSNYATNGFPPHIQTNLVPANYFSGGLPGVPDAFFTTPTNDWHILDLFTTAFNQNAGRGQLSVNQTNMAAWSAVLGGVIVLSNTPTYITNLFILPAGPYNPAGPLPPLVRIVNGINNARTNFANHAFSRLGDVLATPELTMASPYLTSATIGRPTDAVVERIPQQILGLLHGGEQPARFVIYSYGQALKPATHSLYQGGVGGGAYFGLCTNYQITAEVVTRAVVRVDTSAGKPRTVIESFNVLPPD